MGTFSKRFNDWEPLDASDLTGMANAINDNNTKLSVVGEATDIESLSKTTAETERFENYVHNIVIGNGRSHEFVDLGLPSGKLWCKTNIGADTEIETGDYFAWGATKPYRIGIDDTQTYLSYFDLYARNMRENEDAASFLVGNGCYIPSYEDVTELKNNTDYEWCEGETAIGGVAGAKFMHKNNHDMYIFIPMGSYYLNRAMSGATPYAYFWVNECNSDGVRARRFVANATQAPGAGWTYKERGYPIRPVRNPIVVS